MPRVPLAARAAKLLRSIAQRDAIDQREAYSLAFDWIGAIGGRVDLQDVPTVSIRIFADTHNAYSRSHSRLLSWQNSRAADE